MAGEKIKVAVLGGGVGAMSAALALTEIDPAGQKYEITVHQLGWRLGGKCASGRNPQYGQRIEEHGLHIWSGCYENAFTLMRIAFKALNRPPGPLAAIGDAFKRQNDFTLSSDENGPWAPWSFWFPPDDDPNVFPGADSLWDPDPVLPAIDTMIRRLIALVEDWVARHPILAAPAVAPPAPGDSLWDLPEHVHALVARMCNDLERAGAAALLPAARWAAEKLESGDAAALNFAWHDVAGLLRLALALELDAYELTTGRPDDSEETKTVEAILIGTLVTIGAIDNDCIGQGFHTIDGVDFRDFLLQAAPDSLKARTEAFLSKTVLMRAFYDYCFAYEAGDRAKPRLSACSAVQALLRLGLTYKGAFFFKATAGFGDTVFTPIYQVLQSRGVKFKFFHNVTELIPSADGKTIDAIKVDEQVELKLKPGVDEYSPFINVKGIDCWPSEPFWDQFVNGDIYKKEQIDFEAFYSPQPKPFRTLTLKQGQDFDMVVLGI